MFHFVLSFCGTLYFIYLVAAKRDTDKVESLNEEKKNREKKVKDEEGKKKKEKKEEKKMSEPEEKVKEKETEVTDSNNNRSNLLRADEEKHLMKERYRHSQRS